MTPVVLFITQPVVSSTHLTETRSVPALGFLIVRVWPALPI
jgi:hypothetical protein